MTDLQVKYQTMLETQRANMVQETLKEREVTTREKLNEMEINEILIGMGKSLAEIQKLNAETDLTKLRSKLGEMEYQQAKLAYDKQMANYISNVLMIPTWWNTSETANIASAAQSGSAAAKNVVGIISSLGSF